MPELNKSIRSIEHKVAVDVVNSIVSEASAYVDTIAKEESEKGLVSKVREGEKISKTDVEKLLPSAGTLGFGGNAGNLDLLEVLFLESVFSANKVNADNIRIIADVIKSNDTAKKSIEKYLLEYFLVPLEAVWAADQYQNDSFNGLSDDAKKVFNIIYKDFLSTPEAIAAIDLTLNNLQQKDIEKDAFNLIIKRCIEFDVSAENIQKLINKGISLVESDKDFLSDLHSQVKYAFLEKYQDTFVERHNNAGDTGDSVAEYEKIDEDSKKVHKIIKEVAELIEEKGKAVNLEFEGISQYIDQQFDRMKKHINAESNKATGEDGETPAGTTTTEPTETPAAETKSPAPTKPAETPTAETKSPAPTKPAETPTEPAKAPVKPTGTPAAETPKPKINIDDVKTVLAEIYKGAAKSGDVLSIFVNSNLSKDDVNIKVQDLRSSSDYDKQDLVQNGLFICSQYAGIISCLKDKYNEYNANSNKEVTIQGQATEIVKNIDMSLCYYTNNGGIKAYKVDNIDGDEHPYWLREYIDDDAKVMSECHEITSTNPALKLFAEV